MDELLSFYWLEFTRYVAAIVSGVALVSTVNPWLLLASVPFMTSLTWLAFYFLRSAREIKRLQAISCSPLYAQVSQSLEGAAVIRACSMEEALMESLFRSVFCFSRFPFSMFFPTLHVSLTALTTTPPATTTPTSPNGSQHPSYTPPLKPVAHEQVFLDKSKSQNRHSWSKVVETMLTEYEITSYCFTSRLSLTLWVAMVPLLHPPPPPPPESMLVWVGAVCSWYFNIE